MGATETRHYSFKVSKVIVVSKSLLFLINNKYCYTFPIDLFLLNCRLRAMASKQSGRLFSCSDFSPFSYFQLHQLTEGIHVFPFNQQECCNNLCKLHFQLFLLCTLSQINPFPYSSCLSFIQSLLIDIDIKNMLKITILDN